MTMASDDRFGFHRTPPEGTPEAKERVGRVAAAVADGCAIALTSPGTRALAESLDTAFAREFRSFAYEGAGMGLALLDSLHEGKEETLFSFVNGPGVPYPSGVFIGIGLALARLGQNPLPMLGRYEPPLRWRILDGFGFYLGMTEQHYAQGSAAPSDLVGSAQRVFDQGLGRSFWFSHGCEADKIKTTIDVFSASRHADLWRGVGVGVGVGCRMAGGASKSQVRVLKAAAAEHLATSHRQPPSRL